MSSKKKKSGGKGIIIGSIVILAVVVVLVIIFSMSSGSKYAPEDVDAFAKCLKEKGVLMYGTFWCPKCAEQKKMFGSSWQFIDYVECDARGENEQAMLCIEKEVLKYPDWEFPDRSRLVGVVSFEELAERAGCSAPEKL